MPEEDTDTRRLRRAVFTLFEAEMKVLLEDQGYDDYSFATVAQYEPNPAWNGKTISEINVMSGVRLSRAYMPGMLERGWGRIVFISSESALNIPKEMIHYGFTKTDRSIFAKVGYAWVL